MGEASVLAAYVRHLKARKLRPASVTAYTSWLKRLDRWAECSLLAVDTDDLEEWIADHDWAPASHQKAVQAIRAFYDWAQATGRMRDNPAASLTAARVPRGVPSPCPETVYAAALDRATGQTYWRIRLAGETGLRRTELSQVHSADVQRLIGGPVLRVRGKGGSQRMVPLPEDLAAWLELQYGWVFPATTGTGHLAPNSVGRWYTRALKVHPHALRHRYATLAYAATRDLTAVKELLGHASVATTQVYVAVAGEDLQAAAAGAWQPIQRPDLQLVE